MGTIVCLHCLREVPSAALHFKGSEWTPTFGPYLNDHLSKKCYDDLGFFGSLVKL
jgi:hypothetical protein